MRRAGLVHAPTLPAAPVSTWRDRWWATRDRLLASPRFQRWAAAFPLTRPIARRQARALFDLCAGFVYAQVLYACIRLNLLDILAEEPQTADRLAGRLGLSSEATERLLLAAHSLGLVQRRGQDRFGLGPLGAAARAQPGIARMVEHHHLLYADLADPVALLRGTDGQTALRRYWAYAGAPEPARDLTPDRVAGYSALMAASQAIIATEILDSYDVRRHRCLLDVGGGEGAFLAAVAARAPSLRLILFDLPSVVTRATGRLGSRAETVGGDFRTDPLPAGADIAALVRVVHDHDDDVALGILKAVRRALPIGGTLLVAEPMSQTRGAEPIGDAYFGFYLLAMGSGRPRTPAALATLLQAAGFERIRLHRTATPMLVRTMSARVSARISGNV